MRLKPFLNQLISPQQSAFVPGRSIFDNIVIAHECMFNLKKKKRLRVGDVVMKLDMYKAYDSVEWGFLFLVLQKMGFDAR